MSDEQLEKLPPIAQVFPPINDSVDMRHEQVNTQGTTPKEHSKAVQELPTITIEQNNLKVANKTAATGREPKSYPPKNDQPEGDQLGKLPPIAQVLPPVEPTKTDSRKPSEPTLGVKPLDDSARLVSKPFPPNDAAISAHRVDVHHQHADAMKTLVDTQFDQIDTDDDGRLGKDELLNYKKTANLGNSTINGRNLDTLANFADNGVGFSLASLNPWHKPIGLTKADALEVSEMVRSGE